jgi:Glycosyltransferase family 87
LLAPLGFLPPSVADIVWFIFLIACVFVSIIVLKKTLGLQHKHVMRITGLLCLSGPEWEAIRHGQLTPPLLLSLCLALLSFSRTSSVLNAPKLKQKFFDQSAASALALTPLLLKPQLAIPVIVFLIGAARYKVIALLAALGALLNVVSLAVFGSSTFTAYFELLKRVKENRVWQAPEVTPTIRGQLLRFFPDADSAVMLASVAALCIAMICVYLIGRKFRKSPYWYEYLALGALPIGLFTALHCHNYDLLLLLPTIAVFVFGASTRDLSSKRKMAWLLAIVLFIMPIYNKVHYEYLLVGAPVNLLFIDLGVVALASVIWLLRRPAAESE